MPTESPEGGRGIAPALWIVPAALAVAYALYALFRHWHFHSSGYDLGIFDQAVWHLSRFEAPASSITGHANLFADHFHPVLMLLVPAYWIVPRPETLLVAQSLLLAASLVPVFIHARQHVGDAAASWIAASYGLFWGMQKAAAFDFHEVAFAPLAIATAILAMETRHWKWFWPSVLMVCCIKEDLVPLVGMFGLRLIGLGEVRRGIAAIVLSIAAFATIMIVVMPMLGGESTSHYLTPHLRAVEGGPLSILANLVTPSEKLRTVAMWLLPFLFLPLRSPLILLAIPLVLSRLLSGSPNHWSTSFHYTAPLAPILAMAAADGLSRVVAGRRTILRVAPVFMCVLCAILPGRLPLWRVFAPGHYQASREDITGFEILATIPDDASVAAQYAVVPHLSRRRFIYGLRPGTPDTDLVIVTAHRGAWPLADFEGIKGLLRERLDRGYRQIVERDGWIVLARPGWGE